MKPVVNMVTATFNRLWHTQQTLPNVRATASTCQLPFVITVVDNGSTDGSVEYLKELHKHKVIDTLILLKENIGVARAQNIGWKFWADRGVPIYGKIDNDVIFRQNSWLDAIVGVLNRAPEIGALGYNCEAKNQYPVVFNGQVAYRWKGGNIGGACFFVPKSTHDKLGYWCQDFDKYGEEDADYGVRIMLSNLRNAYMVDEEVMEHLPEPQDAYRKFKDDQRAQNLRGIWNEICHGYQAGTRSLKVESNCLNEYEYELLNNHE